MTEQTSSGELGSPDGRLRRFHADDHRRAHGKPLRAGSVSDSGPEARTPNYVTSQATRSPGIGNDTWGAAMPVRGQPRELLTQHQLVHFSRSFVDGSVSSPPSPSRLSFVGSRLTA